MELYTKTAYELAERLTKKYSTSFSSSSTLFSASIRPAIYAIYGLVRIADEIVDTYTGDDREALLDAIERDTYAAIARGYSENPIIHAFADTARTYAIERAIIEPFFSSMRFDLSPAKNLSAAEYQRYIYGSAEVIGLMCLRVFTAGNNEQYESLKDGARSLGAAYQKVNFLRDMKSDYDERGRVYFPALHSPRELTDDIKADIIADIESDFDAAAPSVTQLPASARKAVQLSVRYYSELLRQLQRTPARELITQRVRVPDGKKLVLYIRTRWL